MGGGGGGGQKEKPFVAEVLPGHPPLPFQAWKGAPLVTLSLLSALSLSQYMDQYPLSNASLC